MSTQPSPGAVTYPSIRGSLRTGDLIFLHGENPLDFLIEDAEQAVGEAPYSHVGMVIGDGSNLYLWDAPGGGTLFPDPYWSDPNNRTHGGPQAHDGCRVSNLDDVLRYYASVMPGNQFWVRQLQVTVTDAAFEALRIFINRVDGFPFPQPKGPGLLENYAAGQKGITIKWGSYFCAQLVADSYMRMGLLDMEPAPPNAYSPGTWSIVDMTRLPLIAPAALGPNINVVWDEPS